MSHLTEKQEAFAQAFVGGMNASDAYRSAYDAGAMKSERIHEEASILLKHPKVSPRIAELKAKVEPKIIKKLEITIESLIDELNEIKANALTVNQNSAAVSAVMGKAKIAGMITDKIEAKVDVREQAALVTLDNVYGVFDKD